MCSGIRNVENKTPMEGVTETKYGAKPIFLTISFHDYISVHSPQG
jgi:hypothetical protein